VPLANPPVPYSISGGILTIVGAVDANNNPVDDDMSLNQSGSTITLVDNGNTYAISAVGLTGILVDAGGGSDFVGLAQSNGKSTINLSATLLGGPGDDVLRGGNGNDSLSGGAGNDALSGNAGSDVLNGGIDAPGLDSDGRDTMAGGPGNDSVRYDGRSTPLFLSLDGVANDGAVGEQDLIGSDIENVFGGRGDDSITGDGRANFLTGGKGADTIRGGAGNDKLVGSCRGDVGDSVFGDAGTDLIILGGDNAADHYNVGPGEIEGVSFVTKDPKPGGGFLDVPI
jgi:Ca2+-binding RTX toxin-like protein